MMGKYAPTALILAILSFVFLSGVFIRKERAADELSLLKEENASLKLQLSNIPGACIPPSIASAKVLSVYPLNVKSSITLNVGSADGVENGAAVVWGSGILVGVITDVFARTSVAKTVYNPGWQISVRIGDNETDGLLVGGADPRVTLIPSTKPIAAGDAVYSASADIPYGLKIGTVRSVSQDAGDAFQTAKVDIGFNINDLRTVSIAGQ